VASLALHACPLRIQQIRSCQLLDESDRHCRLTWARPTKARRCIEHCSGNPYSSPPARSHSHSRVTILRNRPCTGMQGPYPAALSHIYRTLVPLLSQKSMRHGQTMHNSASSQTPRRRPDIFAVTVRGGGEAFVCFLRRLREPPVSGSRHIGASPTPSPPLNTKFSVMCMAQWNCCMSQCSKGPISGNVRHMTIYILQPRL
jgi:hypothetical protein